MNLNGNKRSSCDDINERRKRRRTISNDLNRGFNVTERNFVPTSNSDTDFLSSSDDDEASVKSTSSKNKFENGASSSHCNRCANCKCDEVPKLLKVHSEILTILSDMKKKNADMHKSLMLEMQICRQEVIEEIQQLKESFSRMVELTRRTNYNQENLAYLEIHDDHENENGDDDDDDDSVSDLSSDDDIEERHQLFR